MIYMMKPNDIRGYKPALKNGVNSHKVRSWRQRVPWKLLVTVLLVLLLMTYAWIEARGQYSSSRTTAAVHDFDLIYNWSDQLLLNGAMEAEWSFRWDVTMLEGTMEQLADELFISDKGARLAKSIRKDGEVIDGSWLLPSSKLSLARTERDRIAEKVTLTLQVNSSHLNKSSQLRNAIERLNHALTQKDQQVQMIVKVFGQANDKEAINEVKRISLAQQLDEYRDPGTITTTMFSNKVKQYRWLSEGKMANIQVSEHIDSLSGTETVTIGIPLISGEFGSTYNITIIANE